MPVDMQEFFAAKVYEKEKRMTSVQKEKRRYGVMKGIERADVRYVDWMYAHRVGSGKAVVV